MSAATLPVPKKGKIAMYAVPLLLVSVVIMMVVPLPKMLLDLLLASNISIAIVILLTSMMVRSALEFSVFPALLLVTTLFRLSLNVSTTRLILLHGDAGNVIQAFGNFVVGGNMVVGLVIFLILVVIQFSVITAGSGRVAEVSARFTLDAMPGKQMAIDADLNSGLITETEAKQRRIDVAREADFYGAMDGASKFIKGDAMAAIVIVMINLLGGFVIGIVQHHLSLGDALSRYAILSVGDGLVSQIPALLISVASGIVVTRVASDDDGGLGGDVATQLFRSPKALRLAGGGVGVLALLPGLPKLPFIVLAVILLALGARSAKAETTGSDAANEPTNDVPVDPNQEMIDSMHVDPLALELAPDLLDLLGTTHSGSLMDRVKALRKRVASELGLIVPPIHTRDQANLPPSTYVLLVHGVEVARGEAPAGNAMVLGEDAAGMPGRATVDPVFGLPAKWVATSIADMLAADGATVIDRGSVIVTHLSEVIRRHAGSLLSRQDVARLVDAIKSVAPSVAGEVGGDVITFAEVQRVMRALLEEGVAVRDLPRILEAVTAKARENRAPEGLIEAARQALGPAICASAASGTTLYALTLDPLLEQSLLECVRSGDQGSWLAIDPVRMEGMLEGLTRTLTAAENTGVRPVLCCSAQLRPAIRRLVATSKPDLKVISYAELSRSVNVEPVGVVSLAQPVAV
jgi:flagellar biosynthesis protein FlhA